MYRHAQLKGFAHGGGLDALSDATPEGGVEQNHVNSRIEYVCCELFEINNDGIRCKRHPNLLACATHAVQPVNGIFEVVVSDVFDPLAEPDGSFCRPDGVWIETEAVAIERLSNRAIKLQFVLRRENSAL